MINLGLMPCSNCLHYAGIKQPKKKEINEYIACSIAKSGKSNEFLEIKNNGVYCRFQEKEDTDDEQF